MVGVPRSKGCLACIQRRIKCDESRPACQRCQKKGTSCPGYIRDRKFHFYCRSENELGLKSTSDQHQLMLAFRTPIDATVAPSLAGKVIAQRYREGFCDFVESYFPGQFFGYSTRVGTNWFDVVHNYQEAAGKALDLGLRSLGALHIGRSQGDDRLGLASREMYGQALNQLARTLRNPALVTADNTLAAAILLGGFEMSCSTGQESWMLHSRGISNLYQIRGARTHVEGLGRTLLSSFRGFLVYEALVRGERCFLEDEEWRSIIPDMVNEERRRGKFSRLGELIEYSFHEIARCPGFLSTTRALVASANTTDREREQLMTSISDCQRALLEYHSEGIAAMNASQQPNNKDGHGFFGPIPSQIQVTFGDFSLQGMSSAIALLQQLLVVLKSNGLRQRTLQFPSIQQQKTELENASYPLMMRSINGGRSYGTLPGPQQKDSPHTWLDRVSMTMGMLQEAATFSF
ncbi:hypothetical protein N7474_004209 [Penicillium riverlandense]|uniref:uncharacterized protein n=1 Tax=Penicillium riverlandense TaxID=1903569 RepID=UPI0025472573|nr:uncharacterized protein N7474_004209 [Penicillium riverlandense]KAJ5818618.1 hypothetical protein N7474_004209 [Penicillium riverlandense]